MKRAFTEAPPFPRAFASAAAAAAAILAATVLIVLPLRASAGVSQGDFGQGAAEPSEEKVLPLRASAGAPHGDFDQGAAEPSEEEVKKYKTRGSPPARHNTKSGHLAIAPDQDESTPGGLLHLGGSSTQTEEEDDVASGDCGDDKGKVCRWVQKRSQYCCQLSSAYSATPRCLFATFIGDYRQMSGRSRCGRFSDDLCEKEADWHDADLWNKGIYFWKNFTLTDAQNWAKRQISGSTCLSPLLPQEEVDMLVRLYDFDFVREGGNIDCDLYSFAQEHARKDTCKDPYKFLPGELYPALHLLGGQVNNLCEQHKDLVKALGETDILTNQFDEDDLELWDEHDIKDALAKRARVIGEIVTSLRKKLWKAEQVNNCHLGGALSQEEKDGVVELYEVVGVHGSISCDHYKFARAAAGQERCKTPNGWKAYELYRAMHKLGGPGDLTEDNWCARYNQAARKELTPSLIKKVGDRVFEELKVK